ncbi:Aldehyde/histidinol dehydrogenase [Pisolithus albus]|nr:Aldehyde/histidinol dehydrogenase [Pisolithus albus]
MILTVQPVVGAIAAGCCAVFEAVQSSTSLCGTPHRACPQAHPDTSAYRVISGAIPDTTKILELLNQWSHLFYTGNGKVPRIVTSAAAERLTPCSLELGWKSPVVVDAAFDREFSAKHYMFPEKNKMSSIEDLKRPTIPSSLNGVLHDAHYGDIVNNFHFKRERVGGVFDGRRNPARRWFELVIVEGVDENDSLLQEEIPGALLPIAAVDSLDEPIGSVDAGLDQVQYEPLTSMSMGPLQLGSLFAGGVPRPKSLKTRLGTGRTSSVAATGRVRKDADARDTIVWLRLLE